MIFNLSVCSIKSVLSGLFFSTSPKLYLPKCRHVAWYTHTYTQNNNIKIKWCTYLSKAMLNHHSPAKSGHSIKKRKLCGTCALSVWDTSHRGKCTCIHLLQKTWLSLINRYRWIKYDKKRSVGILCTWNHGLAHMKMQKINNILMP